MGIDLMLLPLDCDIPAGEQGKSFGFSHTILPVDRSYSLWEMIKELPTTELPENFTAYVSTRPDNEPGYGQLHIDPYMDPILCVTAGDLARVLVAWCTRDHENSLPLPVAAWLPVTAYVEALPSATRIALFWH